MLALDKPQPLTAVIPFPRVVESLLSRELDSPEFRDAAEVASGADVTDALRQLAVAHRAAVERRALIVARMDRLRAEHPGLVD